MVAGKLVNRLFRTSSHRKCCRETKSLSGSSARLLFSRYSI